VSFQLLKIIFLIVNTSEQKNKVKKTILF